MTWETVIGSAKASGYPNGFLSVEPSTLFLACPGLSSGLRVVVRRLTRTKEKLISE
jgi:hypothetical protein